MMMNTHELTLDPDDWTEMRDLGHRMVDDMLTYLEDVRERKVWQPIPDEVKKSLDAPLPYSSTDPAEVYEEFLENILPHPMGNIHPRFWGWVIGTGTPLGMLAEMLAAGMNPNMGGGDHVPNYVEHQVINWCKQIFGLPPEASGLLVSGGSMANLVGLTVARNHGADFDIRTEGMQSAALPMTMYASTETHSSVQKALELLGMGSNAFRQVPVDDQFRIDLVALQEMLEADRGSGLRPVAIVGNAGTINTGAIDDLDALASICSHEGLWFHVDGAFGGLAVLSPKLREQLKGIERADSLAFDLHKWLYMPMEIGCALVRDEQVHRQTFLLTPDYLTHEQRGLAAGSPWFSDYGLQLSRSFRALKAWMSFKAYGLDRLGELIQQNVDQAQYLVGLVQDSINLELMAPVPLNIVCFRYVVEDRDSSQLDDINREILFRLHEGGVAAPSYTTLKGCYSLRVAITNHRSRREDFDILVDEVLKLGNSIAEEAAAA
jgi:glutamate/tyrosine decarboxylase-like PLP-dependent enzyme